MKKLMLVAMALSAALLVCGCSPQGDADSNVISNSSTPALESQIAPPAADAKSYTIAHVEAEPNWDDITQLDIDDAEWTDSFGISAHAKLCYDDQAIHVHMWAEEQDIRATYTPDDLDASCYDDSCLEFFIAPMADDARYLNFEVNPNCAMRNEIGTQKTNRIGLFPSADTLDAGSSRTSNGWEITYQIPFDYIRTLYPAFDPESGMQMRGNFYKCGNLTKNKHYLTWNHVDSDTPNFHVPASFGILTLESPR